MNAYELAKYIEDDIQIQEGIADMLREQADRIAELEKELDNHFKKGFLDGRIEGWRTHKLFHPVKQLSDEDLEKIAKPFLEWIKETFAREEKVVKNYKGLARAIIKEITE